MLCWQALSSLPGKGWAGPGSLGLPLMSPCATTLGHVRVCLHCQARHHLARTLDAGSPFLALPAFTCCPRL